MKKLILFLILFPTLGFAETIGISQESQKDLTIAQQNLQIISCNVIQKEWLPKLLERSGCKIEQDKLICPDEKKVNSEQEQIDKVKELKEHGLNPDGSP